MFVDAVLANVVLFLVGQAFAWLYMRSGRFAIGAGATIVLWISIDWWLVQRYLLAAPAARQVLPLLLLQLTAIGTTAAFVWARVRRHRSRDRRDERHREAVRIALTGEHAAAAVVLRSLCWNDPWDVAAWLGLGDALRRTGQAKAARRAYARASSVDVEGRFTDLLAHRRSLLERPGPEGRGKGGAEKGQPSEKGQSSETVPPNAKGQPDEKTTADEKATPDEKATAERPAKPASKAARRAGRRASAG